MLSPAFNFSEDFIRVSLQNFKQTSIVLQNPKKIYFNSERLIIDLWSKSPVVTDNQTFVFTPHKCSTTVSFHTSHLAKKDDWIINDVDLVIQCISMVNRSLQSTVQYSHPTLLADMLLISSF